MKTRIKEFHVKSLRLASGEGVNLLTDVRLQAVAGEAVAVMGASGAGKSLLLRALTGQLPPHLKLDAEIWTIPSEVSERMGKVNLKSLSGQVVYVPQIGKNALPPYFHVGRLLKEITGAHLTKTFDSEITTRMANVLRGLGLEPCRALLEKECRHLSEGMSTRVALAAALLTDACILALDEPTKGVDILTRSEIINALRGILKSGRVSLLLASHDMFF